MRLRRAAFFVVSISSVITVSMINYKIIIDSTPLTFNPFNHFNPFTLRTYELKHHTAG